MTKVVLNSRSYHADHEWSEWRVVYLIKKHENCWHIWSWREPFGRYVHKKAMGERVQQL